MTQLLSELLRDLAMIANTVKNVPGYWTRRTVAFRLLQYT